MVFTGFHRFKGSQQQILKMFMMFLNAAPLLTLWVEMSQPYFLKRYIFIHIRTINFVTKKYTKKHPSHLSWTCRVFKCKSRLVAETRPYRRAAHCRALPVVPVTSASHPLCRHEARWKPKKIQRERPGTAVHRTKKATNAVDLRFCFWKGGWT